jgi:hypothetical protein
MSLLGNLARAYVVNRVVRGGRGRPRSRYGYGYGSGYGRRRPARSGFGMRGPLPSYSRRTRGGSRVTVTGCCLPIPLALAVGGALAGRSALRAR